MILVLLILAGVYVWWRVRRSRGVREAAPLAGLDTGVRSPFRTPGRRIRRGF